MREDIVSIPVNDVFRPKDGCPFCRMRDMLEDRMAAYITGAAMMEPNVRVETNRLGFCHTHFEQMLSQGSRLSVALILESLLHEVEGEVLPEGKTAPKKIEAAVQNRERHCFICENIHASMDRLVSNTVNLWRTDPEFRQLYHEQPSLCLRHYGMALSAGQKQLPKKEFALFQEETRGLAQSSLREIAGDVTHFTKMFDYRNAGGDFGSSRDSIERAIAWLTSRRPEHNGTPAARDDDARELARARSDPNA